MNRIKLSLLCAGMLLALPSVGITPATADEGVKNAELEAKLASIEDRLNKAQLVIKKLKHDYMAAAKNEKSMAEAGLPPEDIKEIEHEFKHKVERMIADALAEIDGI